MNFGRGWYATTNCVSTKKIWMCLDLSCLFISYMYIHTKGERLQYEILVFVSAMYVIISKTHSDPRLLWSSSLLLSAVMWWSSASVSPGPRLWPWSPASPKWVLSHSCSTSNLSLTGWRKRTTRTMIFAGGPSTTGILQPVCPTHPCIRILIYISTET